MSAQGVSHDQWWSYNDQRMEALHSAEFAEVNRYVPYSDSWPTTNIAAARLLQHRVELLQQRRRLMVEWQPPDSQLVIVCPVAETGPVGDDFTFLGMRVIPEHSATEYRVVWERPV